jgi:hypothetical protein
VPDCPPVSRCLVSLLAGVGTSPHQDTQNGGSGESFSPAGVFVLRFDGGRGTAVSPAGGGGVFEVFLLGVLKKGF